MGTNLSLPCLCQVLLTPLSLDLGGVASEGLPGAGGKALKALGPPSHLSSGPTSPHFSRRALGLDARMPGEQGRQPGPGRRIADVKAERPGFELAPSLSLPLCEVVKRITSRLAFI